ncbi:MAG: hypothetical protein ACSHXF_04200 [Aquaticitalea sp.]
MTSPFLTYIPDDSSENHQNTKYIPFVFKNDQPRCEKFKFYGIFSNLKIDQIDSDVISMLISKGVIIEIVKEKYPGSWFSYNDEGMPIFKKIDVSEKSNSDSLQFPLNFNNVEYELTKSFKTELFDFLCDVSELPPQKFEIDEFDHSFFELDKFLNNEDKILWLESKYKEYYPEDRFLFLVYRGQGVEYAHLTNGVADWKQWFDQQLDWFPEVIKLYLTSEVSEHFPKEIGFHSQIFYNQLIMKKNEIDNDFFEFLEDWHEYRSYNDVLNSIQNKFNELKNTNQNKSSGNSKRLTPLEQICFIEQLRESNISFSKLEYENKLKYLNLISNGENYDENFQIEKLEEMIMMNPYQYESFYDKGQMTKFAKKLNEISRNDVSNLRKAIKICGLTAIKEGNARNKNYLPLSIADVKHNDKFYKAQKRINSTNNLIKSLIESLE